MSAAPDLNETSMRGLGGRFFAAAVLVGCVALPVAHALPAPQSPQQSAAVPGGAGKQDAVSLTITYVDGQLTIKAANTTLAEVLSRVAGLTGVKFEVPPTANNELVAFVALGPGTAREVLAELLSDSSFDYLLAASESDPDRIQSVLVMPREAKGSKGNRMEVAARTPRSPYGRPAPVEAEVAQPQDSQAVPTQAAPATPDGAAPNSQPASAAPSNQASLSTSFPQGQSNVPPTAPVPLPSSLDNQTINNQLQQMYQQRMQMNQVGRPGAPPVLPGGPGND